MPISIDPTAWYSPDEAEPILNKKPSTQAKDRSLGRGPRFTKAGKLVTYLGADLLEYLHQHRVAHGAEFQDRFGRGV